MLILSLLSKFFACVKYTTTFETCQVIFETSCVVEKLKLFCVYYSRVIFMQGCFLYKYKCLGQNIAYYRKLRGFSQLELAEMIDVSRTHMSRIETADCAVSLDVIFQICKVLGISESKLFDFRD